MINIMMGGVFGLVGAYLAIYLDLELQTGIIVVAAPIVAYNVGYILGRNHDPR
jgi:hypothetical protein